MSVLNYDDFIDRLQSFLGHPQIALSRETSIRSLDLDSLELLTVVVALESMLSGLELPFEFDHVPDLTLGELHHIYAAQAERSH